MFGLSEIAIILIVVILVFGAKKLPELARSAGKSARILKAEAKAMREEKEREEARRAAAQPPQVLHGDVVPPDAVPPTVRQARTQDTDASSQRRV
ncbi:Sec-independent protein translocase subunit TatA [Streptomyces sp. A1499]|uniref:Sec-independent protein translocase subunit TatA n=1 Tax=Streptomyces sp. A1499 TaxID=2563104 RepID=UPI00109EA7C0|nr:Sec-independent protein translocase subunit TatA [Streptomyces sp. A1499]THC55204.1 twin-arginine translocase TatA/TatE family subunit [Streptomyces sp. A1499]